MIDLLIGKSQIEGEIEAPPSKSYTHRAVIASSLANGTSIIINPLTCDDTLATINACRMLGANMKNLGREIIVRGVSKFVTPTDAIDCKASASTMRFMLPIAALCRGTVVFTGDESLKRRPMDVSISALSQLGVTVFSMERRGYPPIMVVGRGKIKGGTVTIPGNISSQFITGLLFVLPLADKDSILKLSTKLESKPYVKMTIEVLREFGIDIKSTEGMDEFHIPAPQEYKPAEYYVEGDFSSAAFLFAAAIITNSKVKVKGLNPLSIQADRRIIDILKEMGSSIEVGDDYVAVEGSGEINAIRVDISDSPDLAPVLVALACYAKGESKIEGGRRLALKESNRLESLTIEFKKLGAKIERVSDGFIIRGPCKLKPSIVDSHGDHRVAMACAIAALGINGITRIKGFQCVNKSYPDFAEDLTNLGANIRLVRSQTS